jgi:hypothetical protein
MNWLHVSLNLGVVFQTWIFTTGHFPSTETYRLTR